MDRNGKKLVVAVAGAAAHGAAQRWAQRQGMPGWQAVLIGTLAAAVVGALVQHAL